MSSINKLKAKKENLYKKLDFENVSFQTRIIANILDDLSKKNVLDEQTPELSVLWDKCVDENPIVSRLCCQAITHLTLKGRLEISKTIDEFIVFVQSSRQVGPVIDAIGKILLYEAEERIKLNREYICPYSFLSPVHPFIAILREKQESWPFIMQWLQHVLNNEAYPFQLVKSLLCYVLLTPLQSSNDFFKTNIQHELLLNIDNIKFLYSILPLLQISTKTELTKVIVLIKRLSKYTQYVTKVEKEMMLLISLSVCKIAISHGFNIIDIITVSKIIAVDKDISLFIVGVCITILSILIDCVVGEDLYHILCLGEVLLKKLNFNQAKSDGISKTEYCCISPYVIGMLILPLLNILTREHDESLQNIKNLATELIIYVERTVICKSIEDNVDYWLNECEKCLLICSFHPLISETVNCMYFINSLHNSGIQEKLINTFLVYIESMNSVPPLLLNILCSILINTEQVSVFKNCLKILNSVSVIESNQSLSLLSLYLYILNLKSDFNTQFIILESLPSLATHNYTIGIIINTIQNFINYHNLKPKGIHLMVLLWKKQIRCFPYLKQLLEEEIKDTPHSFNKVLIAQAAAMKEICEIHPQNFGICILKHLSDIFNKCLSDVNSPAVALALGGIFYLCKAGEIDLKSAWKTLARKLSNDKRPLVLKHLFNLLSLAPQLKVSSSSYEKFMVEIVAMLWKHVSRHKDPVSVSAAYKALGEFPLEFHHLKILPDAATRNIILPEAASPLDLGKDPIERFGYVPGYCFTDLLESINDIEILKGYEEFLTGMINFEIYNLPQSVYHSAKMAVKPSRFDNVLSEIPQFLCMRYSGNRQPILQSNLSLGVLLSYHPPVEVDKYGMPTKQSLIAQSKYYQEILEALLQDITIDISEWWQCVLLSFAWNSFMDRAFFACSEGMIANREVEKKDSNKESDSKERKEILIAVRENLLEIIKRQTKEKPSTPANAIMAVVGLAVSFWKYENTAKDYKLDDSEEQHFEFIFKITETMICILDPSRKPNSEIIGWLLVHGKKSGFGSSVLRGCTATSFFHLVPFLMGSAYDSIRIICELLLDQLLPKANAVLQLHSGIGLGLFLQALCREGQTEGALKIITRLENIIKENEELMPGSLISLSLSIISLCHSDEPAVKNYSQNIWNFYVKMLHKADSSSLCFDVLCQCTAMLTVTAWHNNVITTEQCEDFCTWIDTCYRNQPHSSGITVAIGSFIGMLTKLGCTFVSDKKRELLNHWMNILSSEDKPNLQRLAALRGLCSLYTKFSYVCSFDAENETSAKEMYEIIQLMMKLFKKSNVVLQNVASWLLGELYSISGGSVSSSSLPTNYNYLHEKYLLRALVNFILKATKDSSLSSHLNICLNVLSKKYSKPLPPISWTAVLSPLLQKDDESVYRCLRIFISQSSSSSSASLFLSTIAVSPKFTMLPIKCRQFLISSLPVLLKCLPATKLNLFLSSVIIPIFSTKEQLIDEGVMTLNAVSEALSKNLNENVNDTLKSVVNNTIINSFERHIDVFQSLKLTSILCSCLLYFSSESLEYIIKKINPFPATVLCCELISKHKLTLTNLHFCIEAVSDSNDEIKYRIIEELFNFFIQQNIDIKENTSKQKVAADWLMEIMNLIMSKIRYSSTYSQIDFLLDIFALSVLSYLGIEVTYIINFYGNKQSLLSALPAVLPKVLQVPTWNYLETKIFEFFLHLESHPEVRKYTNMQLLAVMCSLRGYQEFTKMSVYSKIFSYLESFKLI